MAKPIEGVTQTVGYLPRYVATDNTQARFEKAYQEITASPTSTKDLMMGTTGHTWKDMSVEAVPQSEQDMHGKYPVSLQQSASAVCQALSSGYLNKEQINLAINVISDLMRQNKILRQTGRDGASLKEAQARIKLLEDRLRAADSISCYSIGLIIDALGDQKTSLKGMKSSLEEKIDNKDCPAFMLHSICEEAMPAFKAARERVEEVAGLQDLREALFGEEASEGPAPIRLKCLEPKTVIKKQPDNDGFWLYREDNACQWRIVKITSEGKARWKWAQFVGRQKFFAKSLLTKKAEFLGPYNANDRVVGIAHRDHGGYFPGNPTDSQETDIHAPF